MMAPHYKVCDRVMRECVVRQCLIPEYAIRECVLCECVARGHVDVKVDVVHCWVVHQDVLSIE